MPRIFLAIILCGIAGSATVVAAPPDDAAVPGVLETPDQVYRSVLLQAVGSPARADIGDRATLRLADGLTFIPRAPAIRLLAVLNQPVPPDFQGILTGPEGMDAQGMVRFVAAGFIDANAALAWTDDDILASLNDTVARTNQDRAKQQLEEREARRWVAPPRYNAEAHQIAWSALIVPKSAPREADGEIRYQAIAFGREGYVEIAIVTSMEKAGDIGQMAADFLAGLTFRPGQAYNDVLPTDRRAAGGLAAAMGIDKLRKAASGDTFLSGDRVIPLAGGIVAATGAISLFFYVQRYLRRRSRRL